MGRSAGSSLIRLCLEHLHRNCAPPNGPDRHKREKVNSSTPQDGKRKICVHDILPEEMIGCGLGSILPLSWRQPSRDLSGGQIEGRRVAIRRAVSLIRSSLQNQDWFKNLRRPDRKSPCCHGPTRWQRRHISSHDWNRTRAENPTHRNRYPVEFASAHLRL
jgi:hypothetical protein